MIEVPNCDYTYTQKDNDAALTRWTMHTYINDSIIDAFFSPGLDTYKLDSWYSAFLKIEGFMYPVLFRGPISRKRMDYQPVPDWCEGTTYRLERNIGPSIEDNEICVSRNVLEAMIWQGHMPYFTMKNGYPEVKSSLDKNQTCAKYRNGIDIEVIPYYFTDKLLDYFDFKNENWLNSKFKLTDNPYHVNPFINSINEHATKDIELKECIIGEQGRTEKIDLSEEWTKSYNTCYFLSFTSYGSINILFDRQKVEESKKLKMETGKSIEESMLEYNDWCHQNGYSVSIGSKEPTEARIVIDNSGVNIDDINDKKKVEEDDELLLI